MFLMAARRVAPLMGRAVVSLAAAAALAGCATLPPAVPVHDVRQIAGQWAGEVETARGATATTVTVKDNGRAEWSAGAERGTATFRLVDGKVAWKGSGRTATLTLHEGDGRRLLRFTCDGGFCRGTLAPAPAPAPRPAPAPFPPPDQGLTLRLTWADHSRNEDGFRIERRTGTNGSFGQVATVGPNVAAYLDAGLAAGTTYCYRLRAFNAAGHSAYSDEACATTADRPAPRAGSEAALAGLAAVPVRDLGQVAGTWEGYVKTRRRTVPATTTLREDGTAEWQTPAGREAGTWRLVDGKIAWNSPGWRATITLHEATGDDFSGSAATTAPAARR